MSPFSKYLAWFVIGAMLGSAATFEYCARQAEKNLPVQTVNQ